MQRQCPRSWMLELRQAICGSTKSALKANRCGRLGTFAEGRITLRSAAAAEALGSPGHPCAGARFATSLRLEGRCVSSDTQRAKGWGCFFDCRDEDRIQHPRVPAEASGLTTPDLVFCRPPRASVRLDEGSEAFDVSRACFDVSKPGSAPRGARVWGQRRPRRISAGATGMTPVSRRSEL